MIVLLLMIITSFVWLCCVSFGKTLTAESVNCQVATGYSSMDIFLKTYYKCWESSNSAQLMRFKLCEEYWQGIAKKSRLLTLVCRAFNQERSIRNHQQHVEFTDNESTIEANKASNRRTTTKQTTRDSEDYTTRHRNLRPMLWWKV